MISVNELYYLNRALDGKSIYGIPFEVNEKIDLFGASKAKQNLIKENILDKDGSINDLSFLILVNLREYKRAKDYIWVNDLVMAVDKKDFLIYFKKKDDGKLLFKKTTKEAMIFNIVKEYEFLWGNKEEKKQCAINISVEEFLENNMIHKENKDTLYIQKVSNKEIISRVAYYEEENRVYKYDFYKEKAITTNPLEVRRELLNLYNMEVN